MSTHVANRINEILVLVREEQNAIKPAENMSNVTDISYRKWQVNVIKFVTEMNILSEPVHKLHGQYLLDAKNCISIGNEKLQYLRQLIANQENELVLDLKERATKSINNYQTTLNQIDRMMLTTTSNVTNIMLISSSIKELITDK